MRWHVSPADGKLGFSAPEIRVSGPPRCRRGAHGFRAEHIPEADQDRRAASGAHLRTGDFYARSHTYQNYFEAWCMQGALVRASRYVTLMQVSLHTVVSGIVRLVDDWRVNSGSSECVGPRALDWPA